MIQLIIYDLDGTLIDSRRDIADAVNWTLKELGLGELPSDKVSSFVGSGVTNLMRQSLADSDLISPHPPLSPRGGEGLLGEGGVSDSTLKRAIKLFRRRYSEHLLDQTKLYPSVRKVLEFFKDRKQAVVTNKPENFSLQILEGLGIRPYFFRVFGGDTGFSKKPAPEGLLEILRAARVGPEASVLVGDSAVDIETGRNAGVQTFAVTYGFGKREEIEKAGPDRILTDLEELISCLR